MMAEPAKLLLVEGRDDEHSVIALWNARVGGKCFEIRQPGQKGGPSGGGVSLLLQELPGRLKVSGLEILGVLVDADEDPISRWTEVGKAIQESVVISIPATPPVEGFVAHGAIQEPHGLNRSPTDATPLRGSLRTARFRRSGRQSALAFG